MDKNEVFITFDEEFENKELDILFGKEDEILIKILSFSKIITHHFNFCKQLNKLLKLQSTKYNSQKTIQSASFKNFNRAFFYIKDLDLKDIAHVNALLSSTENEEVEGNFEYTLKYFESIEEYEKCSFILKIQKIFQNNLEL